MRLLLTVGKWRQWLAQVPSRTIPAQERKDEQRAALPTFDSFDPPFLTHKDGSKAQQCMALAPFAFGRLMTCATSVHCPADMTGKLVDCGDLEIDLV